MENIAALKKDGGSLETMIQSDMEKMLETANEAYYCRKENVMTNEEYDKLKEATDRRFPKN
jgi:ABC-type transporter Mla maintaining outer membrane lipid asymmetry ATPase subunit MlaF